MDAAARDLSVGVVGLGYVGLPLAVALGRLHDTVGFDVSSRKVDELRRGIDRSGEVSREEIASARRLSFASAPEALAAAHVVVLAVPTPVDAARLPDFGPLLAACRAVAPHLRQGAIAVFESTVYPGATEEVCIPELERASGRKWKRDFFVGYSPERINPGDREHSLARVVKVVAGDTPRTLQTLAALYAGIVPAGVHRASSIRVAEAAKVIENTQRDLNIALMNELAIIFHRIGIDTREVLEAAGTKWNFLRFTPGLVGGHCIGVDPYYLTHAAQKAGHHPEVILAGRRINDGMGRYVAEQTVKCLAAQGLAVNGALVNVLGIAFKENCADLRNSKVADVVAELAAYGVRVRVHDPLASGEDALREYGLELAAWDDLEPADAVVLAVTHRAFLERPLAEIAAKVKPAGCVIDVKSALDREALAARGLRVWRL